MIAATIDLLLFDEASDADRKRSLQAVLESLSSHGFVNLAGHGFTEARLERLHSMVSVR